MVVGLANDVPRVSASALAAESAHLEKETEQTRLSLMVTGVSHDWAYCDGGVSRMHVASAVEEGAHFRTF